MASELGPPNREAARERPLQRQGRSVCSQRCMTEAYMKLGGNTVLRPFRTGDFCYFPVQPASFRNLYPLTSRAAPRQGIFLHERKECMMNFKKTIAVSLAALAVIGAVSGCGGDQKKEAAPAEKKEITVGVTPGYSEQVMEFVAKEAEKQGLKVNVKSFADYVTPDQALAQGDIDLNSFQHGPFLDAFNEKNGTHLISIGNTFLAPLRIYSGSLTSVKDVPDGAKVSIPNDPSNGGRALLLLEKQGLIKLKDGTDPTKAVVGDIVSNPKNLQIIELEAAQLPRSLDDVAISVINAGYAHSAGLDTKKALATEDNTSPYVNIIAAREQDKDNPTYQKFMKIYQSDSVRKYINDNFSDGLVPAF